MNQGPSEHRRALVFGMASYTSTGLENLPGVIEDANQIANLLKYNVDGSDNFKVQLHVSTDADPIKTEDFMRLTDAWFDAGPISDGVIYFSGHASNSTYGLHLAAADTDGAFDAGFPFDSLLHRANQVEFSSLTIILDCCSAGSAGDVTLDTRFDALLLKKNVAIVAAAREFESAWTGDPVSLFTEQLIGALSDDSIARHGPATVFEVFLGAKAVLPAQGQTPVLKAHISSEVFLRSR